MKKSEKLALKWEKLNFVEKCETIFYLYIAVLCTILAIGSFLYASYYPSCTCTMCDRKEENNE